MNTIFYGAGKWGAAALEKISSGSYNDCSFVGFADSYKAGSFCGWPIVPINEIGKDTVVVITIEMPQIVSEVYYKLCEKNIKNIYWFLNRGNGKQRGKLFLQSECVDCSVWGDCILPQAEIHIADYCNLNCKGCTHFSPVFEKELPVFEERMGDVRLLTKRFSNVIHFSLLGGEPFLNPDIDKYVEEIRKLLPNSYIQIVTNGLLLLNMRSEILEKIRENDITVSISEYEPTHRIIGRIERRLQEMGIDYNVRPYDNKQKFVKPLSLKKDSRYPNICMSNGCVNVWNGKIAKCPTLMYIPKFNEMFQTKLPEEGIYDLNECRDGKILLEQLKKEIPLCKHCINCEMDWEQCGKEPLLEDFATDM